MVLADILGPQALILLVVVVAVFGGTRLAKLARSVGASHVEFTRGFAENEAVRGQLDPKAS